MDKDRIRRIINNVVSEANLGSTEIYFEEDDALRIEVVSEKFKGVRLLKRINMLSELFLDLATTELAEYHLIFNPLTFNEKLNGVSELEAENDQKNNKSGYAASSPHY